MAGVRKPGTNVLILNLMLIGIRGTLGPGPLVVRKEYFDYEGLNQKKG